MHRVETVHSFNDLVYDFDVVIDATGLGSRKLSNDPELYPRRGQVIVARTPFTDRCETFLHEAKDDRGTDVLTYWSHREHGYVLIGGTAEIGMEDRNPSMKTTQEIMERVRFFDPTFEHVEIEQVMVGLRPCRSKIRIEANFAYRVPVIHATGHGGGGYSLAAGTAHKVVGLIEELAPDTVTDIWRDADEMLLVR